MHDDSMEDPADNQASLFRASLDLLEHSISAVVDLMPKEKRELPILEFTPMRMFCQSVSRCQSIHILLGEGFLSEASIILRSLMFDAHYLLYLNKHPAKREALILSLRTQEIRSWEDLAAIAKESGVDTDVEPIIAKAREENQKVQNKMKALGIDKLVKFPAQGASMARTLGRLSDILGHKMYSLTVHSAALSPVGLGITQHGENDIGLHLRNKSPKLVHGLSHSAMEYLFEGTLAVASWQSWDALDELSAKYQALNKAFNSLRQ